MARIFNMTVQIEIDKCQVDVMKAAIRSKDNVQDVVPPPSNLSRMWDHPESTTWMHSLADEFTALTDIGAVSHGHTLEDLTRMGITTSPIATQVVFENKFKPADYAGKGEKQIRAELAAKLRNENPKAMLEKIDAALKLVTFMASGKVTTEVTFDKTKARVVAVGNKRNMQQGLHYHETFAATPKTETSNVLSSIVVELKLKQKAFDIKNAFCWAEQKIKLALDYPFGMPQYNAYGQKMYMALLKNTYGKPDGSHLFEKERNTYWMQVLNEDGFWCTTPYMDQSLFYVELTVSLCTIPKLLDDIAAEAVTDPRLKSMDMIQTWMLVHTDDAKMAGFSDAIMEYIMTSSDEKWKVKEVDPLYMLGSQRILTIDKGIWKMEHVMPLYVIELVKTWQEYLVLAGWEHSCPKTPAPTKQMLTLHDPEGKITEAEHKLVLKRGYMNLCGGLVWPIKQCYPEMLYGVSNITTVMSKPTEKAWSYAMHMLAWMRENKDRGILFSSDNDCTPMATVDASLEVDLHDGRTRAGHDIVMSGGPVVARSAKLQKVAFAIPGAEYMQLRNCSVDVIWLRQLLKEIGLSSWITEPTEIHCDSSGAIDWAKFGKITVGNKHIALAYHEVQQWRRERQFMCLKVLTKFNKSDMYTKSPTIEMTTTFAKWICGYHKPPEGFLTYRKEQRDKWERQEQDENS